MLTQERGAVMLYAMSEAEARKMHEDMAEWAKREMEREYGTYIYNVLNELQKFVQEARREKGIETCSRCLEEFTDHEKYRRHMLSHLIKDGGRDL